MTRPSTGLDADRPAVASVHVEVLVLALITLALSFVLGLGADAKLRVPGPLSALAPDGLPSLCLSESLFHAHCPGCGMTRAFVCMAHGRIVEAWEFNRGGPLLFLIVCLQIPYRLHRIRSRRPLGRIVARCVQVPAQIAIALMIGGWLWDLVAGGLT